MRQGLVGWIGGRKLLLNKIWKMAVPLFVEEMVIGVGGGGGGYMLSYRAPSLSSKLIESTQYGLEFPKAYISTCYT